uniref:Uncharacterized protein n=1 Tax=Lepeophtheirus salmonis TaxID=72036 RepID=A0A0K2UWV6_LEPSM
MIPQSANCSNISKNITQYKACHYLKGIRVFSTNHSLEHHMLYYR